MTLSTAEATDAYNRVSRAMGIPVEKLLSDARSQTLSRARWMVMREMYQLTTDMTQIAKRMQLRPEQVADGLHKASAWIPKDYALSRAEDKLRKMA